MTFACKCKVASWLFLTLTSALEIQGMFAVLPSLLIISFGDFDRDPGTSRVQFSSLFFSAKSETHILRCNQGLNCEKLMLVDELADRIIMKKLNPGTLSSKCIQVNYLVQGLQELDEIIQSPPRYGPISKVIYSFHPKLIFLVNLQFPCLCVHLSNVFWYCIVLPDSRKRRRCFLGISYMSFLGIYSWNIKFSCREI